MPTVWGETRLVRLNGQDRIMLMPYVKYGDQLQDLGNGQRLKIRIDVDRNGKFSGLYHVMLGMVVKAVNRGPTRTDINRLKRWVKLKTGRYDLVPLDVAGPDGQTHAIDYHSTSFKDMDEGEFYEFAMDTCDLIASPEMAPYIKDSPEWPEIMKILKSILPKDEG